MIKFLIFPITVLLLVNLSSCREMKSKETEVTPPTLQSTSRCQNVIKVWLDGGKQFRAIIESDIPICEGVEFSGYYQEGDSFLRLSNMIGDSVLLNKENGIYLMTGVGVDKALRRGWELAPVK